MNTLEDEGDESVGYEPKIEHLHPRRGLPMRPLYSLGAKGCPLLFRRKKCTRVYTSVYIVCILQCTRVYTTPL